MSLDFVADPPSEAIAAALNASWATACVHDRDPCNTYCGVERREHHWQIIPLERRLAWLDRVEKNLSRPGPKP